MASVSTRPLNLTGQYPLLAKYRSLGCDPISRRSRAFQETHSTWHGGASYQHILISIRQVDCFRNKRCAHSFGHARAFALRGASPRKATYIHGHPDSDREDHTFEQNRFKIDHRRVYQATLLGNETTSSLLLELDAFHERIQVFWLNRLGRSASISSNGRLMTAVCNLLACDYILKSGSENIWLPWQEIEWSVWRIREFRCLFPYGSMVVYFEHILLLFDRDLGPCARTPSDGLESNVVLLGLQAGRKSLSTKCFGTVSREVLGYRSHISLGFSNLGPPKKIPSV
ncbi:hypothetical protein BJ138DRAFT_512049 [Hygrophoropsis aurantiaca]|uniref:Uncharacterized protein n=1 Tax=Hygrophoropsis aurantiaca TaxID=72124 RepID=A0ACB8A3S3_9AGAM|nr:hypothetical protein BJ138DRAFT_512049 [Hygrophoropsis aurantiaca]